MSTGSVVIMSQSAPKLPDNWCNLLSQHGYSITEVVKTVGDVLLAANCPYSAEDLVDQVRTRRPETGRASVYRALQKFESLGLVQRVHNIEQCNTYVAVTHQEAVLFVCDQCRGIDWLPLEMIWRDLIGHVLAEGGHRITTLDLQVGGICPTCKS